MEVEKISLLSIGFYFILYITIHILIGLYSKRKQKELKQKPGNQELEQQVKHSKTLFKWFPFIYVIFVILMFFI